MTFYYWIIIILYIYLKYAYINKTFDFTLYFTTFIVDLKAVTKIIMRKKKIRQYKKSCNLWKEFSSLFMEICLMFLLSL